MLCACKLQAQSLIINGSFEQHTATNFSPNLSNAQYNATVSSSSSFGGNTSSQQGEIDLFKTGGGYYSLYPNWAVIAQEGDWFIAPGSKGYHYIDINGDTLPYWYQQDAFSLELLDTLTTGSWYTLRYYIKHKHPPFISNNYLPGRLSVGISHYADSFGVVIDTSAVTDTVWTEQSIHFQATANFAHITCLPVREQIGMNWAFVDNFTLKLDSAGTYTPPVSWNCNKNNGCSDPADGSGTYTTLADCQAACITSTINDAPQQPKQLLKVIDILGKAALPKQKGILFYIYSDGTVEKRITIE